MADSHWEGQQMDTVPSPQQRCQDSPQCEGWCSGQYTEIPNSSLKYVLPAAPLDSPRASAAAADVVPSLVEIMTQCTEGWEQSDTQVVGKGSGEEHREAGGGSGREHQGLESQGRKEGAAAPQGDPSRELHRLYTGMAPRTVGWVPAFHVRHSQSC